VSLPDPYPVRPWTAPCRGVVTLPGSKSLTNRALVLAALQEGVTRLQGALFSRDSRLLFEGLRALGFAVRTDASGSAIEVEGRGGEIPRAQADLFVGNAGTVARFLTALVCLHPEGRFRMDGDEEMRRRPMRGLIECLATLGARFTFHGEQGCFPFEVGTSGLRGGTWRVDAAASSQMLSALMMVAPLASGPVRLHAPGVRPAFVEMTARLMGQFGIRPDGDPASGYRIADGQRYRRSGREFPVEPDATAASYFMILPFVAGGSLLIEGMRDGLLQGDVAFADVLRQLGWSIREEAAGWRVEGPRQPVREAPAEFSFEAFSDTFLTLAAVVPLLPGPVTLSGIGHTRFQETNRIAAMAAGLTAAGARVVTGDDRITVQPLAQPGSLLEHPVRIPTFKDHRVAMSFALLGCHDRRGDGLPWLAVEDPACCGKTFPGFFAELENLYRKCHDD
jgi:3-phosphoshikimate 1-carboxyvinyltransferase